jgi:hypothetical protein
MAPRLGLDIHPAASRLHARRAQTGLQDRSTRFDIHADLGRDAADLTTMMS